MRRYRAEDFWYEISHAPGPDGRVVRWYTISCRRCSNKLAHHANDLADSGLKKFFQHHGWEIGKARNQHLCAACNGRNKKKHQQQEPVAEVIPLRPQLNQLEAAWAAATEEQRNIFWQRHRWEMGQPPAADPFVVGSDGDGPGILLSQTP